jgi:hypothetical protein
LVTLANYGTKNDGYLEQLIQAYRRMSYKVDIVVLTNVPKSLGPDIEVRVIKPPIKDPWSFPFPHKQILADRINDYDLFIYSEDDTLITERNVAAFLQATSVLPENEIAGFMRIETLADGTWHFCDVHEHYHWDPSSVRVIGSQVFAFFTNEHSACYILTQKQLRRAIDSGGFLVEPHQERYDLLVTAATDPYTQCGFRKVICVSQIEDFLLPHLPNKYLNRYGLGQAEFEQQIRALLEIGKGARPSGVLCNTETKLFSGWWSKNYYDRPKPEILSLIPETVRTVLSVGTGWGAIEEALSRKGIQVTAVPIDAVIGSCVEARGIRSIYGSIPEIARRLKIERFDCILFSDILHVVQDPASAVASFKALLATGGIVVASVPNLGYLRSAWTRLRHRRRLKRIGSYAESGLHRTSLRTVRLGLRKSGLVVTDTSHIVSSKWPFMQKASLGWLNPILASEILAVGTNR